LVRADASIIGAALDGLVTLKTVQVDYDSSD